MSADNRLNDDQSATVYHATDPDRARSIMRTGQFRGDAADNYVFTSTHQKSRYMDVYGDARIKLRVPAEHLEEDPSIVNDWEGNEHLMAPAEEHYAIRADRIKPEHIIGAKQANPITGKLMPFQVEREREA